jgi:hypothetical protein
MNRMNALGLGGTAERGGGDGVTESSGTIEQKYTFPKLAHQPVLAWLRHVYVPHPLYYEGRVCSIYYDSPLFDHYDEKRNSDFLKTKVRLRWYERLGECTRAPQTHCFLELKQKVGAVRLKKRLELNIDTDILLADSLAAEELQRLPERLSELSHTRDRCLMPVMLIRYVRDRFIDPRTGSSIALDTEISCDQVNLRLIPATHPVHLGNGVLEIKGSNTVLPASLLPMRSVLTRQAFSKYGRCLEMLADPTVRSL